jgi:DNA-binding GntR family transcriptional regulator
MSSPAAPRPRLGEKTSVAAARYLRDLILAGELKPGQPIGEESIGKQLGISRTPIRETLLLLQRDGLVELPPNRPAIVRRFTADDLFELHSLRAVLEGYAAARAATRLSERQLTALDRSCERYGLLLDEDEDLPTLAGENFTFHDTIVAAADSERLSALLRQATALPLIYQSYMTYSHENRVWAWRDHERITGALRSREADAAEELMKQHVLWARDLAMAHLPLLRTAEGDAEAVAG